MERTATASPARSDPAGAVRAGWVLGGRYRLDYFLARGATAQVFRGTDELLGRRVAVKVFDPLVTDLNSVDRRRVEVEVLASLSDPHLVTVYDAHINDPGRPREGAADPSYVVMELVEGPTLAEEIGTGPVEPARVARVGAAVAAALETMHRRGLVHRDVKPANILSTRDGAVKLADFGLARVLTADDRVTSAPLVMGTAAFFSPEQAKGQDVEAPSDVYSLGLVLLEALTGRREYPGSPLESAVARLLRGPVIPPGLPAPWPQLLAAMTSEDPEARPTAGAVSAALAATHSVATPPRTAALLGPLRTRGPGNQTPAGKSGSIVSRPPSAAPTRPARLVIAAIAAAEAVALSAVLLISPLSGTSPAGPAGTPARTGPAPSVTVPAAAPARPSTPTTHPTPSSRATPTTNGQPAPPTKTGSSAIAHQPSATTPDTPVKPAEPASAAKAPETATSTAGTPTRPVVAQNAGTGNKKDKAKGNDKTKNGNGKSNGKSKGKSKSGGAQP